MPGRFDQDLRFGSHNLEDAFFLVKFLEDVGYDGPRHFDAHAYRTADFDGVRDFARGLHAHVSHAEGAGGAVVAGRPHRRAPRKLADDDGVPEAYSAGEHARPARRRSFNRDAWPPKKRPFEALDQRTVEILLGV